MPTLQPLDYTAIALYMVMMATMGLLLSRLIKDVAVYFKAGGTLPWATAGVSNYMSMFSTSIFVAYSGIAYEQGLVAVTVLWCTVPAALVAAIFLSHRWRRAGILTPTEYLERRFNGSVRQFFTWGGVGFRALDNMIRLYAVGIFISAATPLSLESAILVAGVIVTLYTVAGGLWAVALTDMVQFAVLIFAAMIMVPMSLRAAGGLGAVMETLPEHFDFFRGERGAPLYLLAYYLMVIIKYNANWSFIQRFYSVRDEAAARKVGFLMAFLFFLFPIFYLLPAVVARIVMPELENREMAYVAMILYVLPQGLVGLLIASMFAATMSALDSDFNVMAGVLTHDVYHRLLRPYASGRELMWTARIITVIIGVVAITGALYVHRFGGAFEANRILSGLGIPLSVPLLLGILQRGAQPWGALATVVLGTAASVYLNYHPEISWPVATLTVTVLSVAVMVLSKFVASRDPAYHRRVAAFFERLATPLREKDKPEPDEAFLRSLLIMVSVAIGCVGLLFLMLGFASVSDLSGQLAVGAGGVCTLLGVVGLLRSRRRVPGRAQSTGSE